MEASQTTPPPMDLKALARQIRAHGIEVSKESTRLLEDGEIDRARALSEASTGLAALAGGLEAWRQQQAGALRRIALATATQRASLEDFELRDGPKMSSLEKLHFHKAANITQDAPAMLEEIAQQLDPHNQEGEQ